MSLKSMPFPSQSSFTQLSRPACRGEGKVNRVQLGEESQEAETPHRLDDPLSLQVTAAVIFNIMGINVCPDPVLGFRPL